MHAVTSKLNNTARQHQGDKGVTFFVSLGESNYNFKTREKEWTNYDAALFAKDNQIQFYNDVLIEGAVVTVSGSGIIVELDETGQYKPKLMIQDARLDFVSNDQQRGQQYTQGSNQARQAANQAPQHHAPQQQRARNAPPPNQPMGAYNNNDSIPFDDVPY